MLNNLILRSDVYFKAWNYLWALCEQLLQGYANKTQFQSQVWLNSVKGSSDTFPMEYLPVVL
jgi:hypothetical protein